MAQIFTQTVPRHASWLLVGPPSATALMAQQDVTVTFTDGTSVVVPAGTPAALLGGGTTWDRTKEVVVGYVLKGSGTLLACPEAQLSTLGTDYAPLARVLADSVQVYQPQLGGTTGGALLGSGLEYVIDGGGAAIGTGVAGTLVLPFAATLSGVQLLADQSGSIVVDIYKCTYAGYPPTSAASICGTAKPTLAGAQKYQDTTLAGWTTAITPGDILVFHVDSASTLQRCNVVLTYTRPAEQNALEYLLDGGGSVLATGAAGEITVPWDCTITGCTLLADQSGSLVLDVQHSSYAAYPTATSIVAAAPPTLSAAQKSQDLSLAGWTKALASGDVLTVSVTSVATIQRCALALAITRTDGAGKAAPAVGALAVDHGGTLVGTRPTLNLIDGTGATLTVADNSSTDSVDVTVATSGGGGTTPAVKAYNTTDQVCSSSLDFSFDSTDYDQGTTTPQHDNTVDPDHLTCQQSGIYRVTAFITIKGGATVSTPTDPVHLYLIRVTPAPDFIDFAQELMTFDGGLGGTGIYGWMISGEVKLDVGDYVKVHMNNTGSSPSLTIAGSITVAASYEGWSPVSGPYLAWTRVG